MRILDIVPKKEITEMTNGDLLSESFWTAKRLRYLSRILWRTGKVNERLLKVGFEDCLALVMEVDKRAKRMFEENPPEDWEWRDSELDYLEDCRDNLLAVIKLADERLIKSIGKESYLTPINTDDILAITEIEIPLRWERLNIQEDKDAA